MTNLIFLIKNSKTISVWFPLIARKYNPLVSFIPLSLLSLVTRLKKNATTSQFWGSIHTEQLCATSVRNLAYTLIITVVVMFTSETWKLFALSVFCACVQLVGKTSIVLVVYLPKWWEFSLTHSCKSQTLRKGQSTQLYLKMGRKITLWF
jgi:hypothetical protein